MDVAAEIEARMQEALAGDGMQVDMSDHLVADEAAWSDGGDLPNVKQPISA